MISGTPDTHPTAAAAAHVISVDAMGGDSGPATVVAGLARFLRDHHGAHAILHGPQARAVT